VLTRRFDAATSKPVSADREGVHGAGWQRRGGEAERPGQLQIRNWVCVEEIKSASHVLGSSTSLSGLP
jgi:hypothetical protein